MAPLSLEGEPLLRTKLFIPTVRAKRVPRPQLIERINENLDKALILVSAPAGFGKTSLLSEWAAQAGLPVAWLSLEAGENDPRRFLAYVIAALNAACADLKGPVCPATKTMLQAIQPLPMPALMVTWINELTEISEPFALVLDDYQFITSPGVNEVLTFLLDHVPPSLHLVIATRLDPPWPLHRLRGRQQMAEIRMDDLRFSAEEAQAFLNAVMELSLSQTDVSALSTRTEGWIVGLQMAALSLRGVKDRSTFIQAFSGSHRYLLEYLIEEVLNRQAEGLQRFLLQTSILGRLCASLCDAALAVQGSQATLEHLERSNLFLIPLDTTGEWYRYHHLFADLLQARLRQSHPEELPSLHLRASEWFDAGGMPEEAIKHSLAADDLERTAGLVERYAIQIISRGELTSLLSLYQALPEELMVQRPMLCVLHAWALVFSGQLDRVEPRLKQAEEHIMHAESDARARDLRGSIAIIRSLVADFRGEMPSAIELAHLADELLPSNNLEARSVIPFVLGDGYFATGELDKAAEAFEKIRQIGYASGNRWTITVALEKLAQLKKIQGRLREVEALYREADRLAGDKEGQRFGSMSAAKVGMSDLLREKNELEAARQMALQAIVTMQHWLNPTDLVDAYITLARISLSQKDIGDAKDALKKAEEISRQGRLFTITMKLLEACRVRLWLAGGELDAAVEWAKEVQVDEIEGRTDYTREVELIAAARVLIAQGGEGLERAILLLNRLAEESRAAGRGGRLIEILLLQSIALGQKNETQEALLFLERSLSLAEPEGYVRLFVDEGQPMLELLNHLKTDHEKLRYYRQKLCAALENELHPAKGAALPTAETHQPLEEKLSPRELEVLQLICDGSNNQEIAQKLFISINTVKRHNNSIFSKLEVSNRAEAIVRTRQLRLFMDE